MRSQRTSALPLPTFISAAMPARPRSSARHSPTTRIVYFATHGLVAGDVKGLAEPSLALSIPKQPSELDDGLLTASEVAQLKLNADWVVLSACNTIAGDKPGAEALSGLARVVLLCRRPRAAGLALGGRFGKPRRGLRRRPSTSSRPNPKLGRAEALREGDARLSQRRFIPEKRLSGVLGPLCPDRRGSGPLDRLIVRRKRALGPFGPRSRPIVASRARA